MSDWRILHVELRHAFADLREDVKNFVLAELFLMNHFAQMTT
jgi:hypothetical protein